MLVIDLWKPTLIMNEEFGLEAEYMKRFLLHNLRWSEVLSDVESLRDERRQSCALRDACREPSAEKSWSSSVRGQLSFVDTRAHAHRGQLSIFNFLTS